MPKAWWKRKKKKAETGGIYLLIFGFIILIIGVIYAFKPNYDEFWLIGIALGLISIALGFIAVGMSAKADERQTEILNRMDKNLIKILRVQDKIEQPTGDVLVTPSPARLVIETLAPEVNIEHQSKESAQKRLDEDTQRVGYVRGEIYQLADGSWGVAWGGKHQL